jgi:ribosomal protein L32
MPRAYSSTGPDPFSEYERSSFNMRGESDLINFDDKTTSQSPSSLFIADTTDTRLTSLQYQSSSAIVCLQCGTMGHAEVICPYQIAIKQSVDHDRHLVCGTFGHKTFRFGSYHGCLACKGEIENIINKQLPEHTFVPTTKIESKVTFATRADHFVSGGGWEEHGINEALRRGTKRLSGLGIKEITSGIEAHTPDKHAKAVIEDYDEKADVKPEKEQLLIEF